MRKGKLCENCQTAGLTFTSDIMAVKATFIFIFAGLTGILSITTVQHVSVEVGGTVQIPCQYEDKYRGHVKYLCGGYSWQSCKIEICSDQSNSNKYSISDDKTQRIVTFTFNNLVSGDSDYYWCNVEINNGRDDAKRFQLSVTAKGGSELHVDSQRITGYFDGTVTINCRYRCSGSKQWCRIGGSCVRSSGQIDGADVTTDTSVPGVFAVTMTGLRPQNIGWYWCSCGDLQMPVFLHLAQRPTTGEDIGTTEACTTLSMNTPGKRSLSAYTIFKIVGLSVLILTALVATCITERKIKKIKAEMSPPVVSFITLKRRHKLKCEDQGSNVPEIEDEYEL